MYILYLYIGHYSLMNEDTGFKYVSFKECYFRKR